MADATYGPKVYQPQGGDQLVVASGGSIKIETGGQIVPNSGTQASAPTTALTTITPADAAGTPDYAIAAVTNSSPYGFSNAAEAITLLYVIKNLQTRVNELAAACAAVGITA